MEASAEPEECVSADSRPRLRTHESTLPSSKKALKKGLDIAARFCFTSKTIWAIFMPKSRLKKRARI